MIPRTLKIPSQSFFLFGPRGTGKSTWLRQRLPEATFLDLLDPGIENRYRTHPEELFSLVRPLKGSADIVVDEVQRVPELLTVVHSLIEENKNRRFVLTGSSARKLKRGGVDLLAGRALLTTMHPFTAFELGDQFDFERSLRLGLVPSVIMSREPEASLRAYVTIYLKEEIQAEALVRNLGSFSRFLEVLSFSHAAQINAASIGRDCGVDRKTVELWIEILADLMIGNRLDPFTKRAARALVSHPKFYFFDCGVFRSLRPAGPLDRPEEIDGAALEGLVYQHLRAWIAYRTDDIRLQFWRTRTGFEIDFVLYGSACFIGLEVKNSGRVRPEDLKGLKAFSRDYPEAQVILLYRGEEVLLIDGIPCIPCGLFLQALRPEITPPQVIEEIRG